MKAADVMTREVVTVRPDAPVRTIAKLLLTHRISAAPVVDDAGSLIGMVSESDLAPREDKARLEMRDWWLRLLSEGEELSSEFLSFVEKDTRTARDFMSAPVVTVPEHADLMEVAAVLATHHVKRAPVVNEGRMVGIVSLADLLKALAIAVKPAEHEPLVDRSPINFSSISQRLRAFEQRVHPAASAAAVPTPAPLPSPAPSPRPAAQQPSISAMSFRGLVEHHEQDEDLSRAQAHRQVQEKRHHEAAELLAAELTEAAWRRMMHEAQIAAEKGESEHLLMQFPSEVCTDHGRAVNAPDPSWPATLRGLPAQVFLRWRDELRSRGFGLHAQVIDFPDGVPGDIGLFLSWGK